MEEDNLEIQTPSDFLVYFSEANITDVKLINQIFNLIHCQKNINTKEIQSTL